MLAIWLEQRDRLGWVAKEDDDWDESYLVARRRGRRLTNFLLMSIGLMIIASGLAGRGLLFVIAWSVIFLALLLLVALAFFDMARTHRYATDRLPEIQRRAIQQAKQLLAEKRRSEAASSDSDEGDGPDT
ncbi:MAG: hypothetical protein AAFN70_14210 [Planctomycetota bacterium]